MTPTSFMLRCAALRTVLTWIVLGSFIWSAGATAASACEADCRLERLFARDWEWRLKEFPEFASSLGDHRFDDRLAEISPAASDRRRLYRRELDKSLRAIARDKLSTEMRVSYDVFRWQLDDALAFDDFHRRHGIDDAWNAINHFYGTHIQFSSTLAVTRFEQPADFRNYIARLAELAQRLDASVAASHAALQRGWILPRVTVERVSQQIDRILGQAAEDCSWYAPFRSLPGTMDGATTEELRSAARKVLDEKTLPALKRYRDHVVKDYLPLARETIASGDLPDGQAYYRLQVRSMTSLAMDVDAIHRLGLDEVARIRGQMEGIAAKAGFAGRLQEFMIQLRSRPDQLCATPGEVIDAYRAIGKRIDPLMAKLFRVLPRAPWGVREAAPEEQGNPDHYLPAAADGSRAGYFVVDASRPETRPRYAMTALVLHEAVPGHHLQTARAAELSGLPDFRRHGWFAGYGEGWALYAESLGEELGLYRDDLELLGRYTYEIWRAARLVVDTGIHAKGWNRQQAIDYLGAATGSDPAGVAAEIDRYIVLPGQALAYKVGEIVIRRLREQASTKLGANFDLRDFHGLILDSGPVPLDLLEERVVRWIADEQGRLRARAR